MCGLNKHLFSFLKADCTQISVKKIRSCDTKWDENRNNTKKKKKQKLFDRLVDDAELINT